jgi:hypothetical protein
MLASGFERLTGKSSYKTFPSGTTISANRAVQFDEAGNVAIGATNTHNVGVLVKAASSTVPGVVDVIDENSIWRAYTFTGTYAATSVGLQVDIDAGLTVTLATTTNNDCTVVGGDVAGQKYVDIVFNSGGLGREEVGDE